MWRTTITAALAVAASWLFIPDTALARGGFGGHGGSFHGGGGFHGGAAGFRGGGFGGAGFRAAAIGGGGFRAAAIGGPGFRAIGPVAPRMALGHPGWGHRGPWRRGFWPGVAIGAGIAAGPYYTGYYDDPYYYNDPYYYSDAEYGGCYLVPQRVMTPWGWRVRRIQVCE